jgi:hypothetical protein
MERRRGSLDGRGCGLGFRLRGVEHRRNGGAPCGQRRGSGGRRSPCRHRRFPRCQDKGRVVRGRCAASSQAVFRPIGRKGLVPASWPDPGTSAAIAAHVVGPLRAPRGSRCRPKPAWRGPRLRGPRRSGDPPTREALRRAGDGEHAKRGSRPRTAPPARPCRPVACSPATW